MSQKVLILKSRFTESGGAEKYARCLADAFHQKGCQVTVLTTAPVTGNFPFEIVSCNLKGWMSVSKIWEFDRFCTDYIKTHQTEIIFGLDRNQFQTHIRAGSGVHRTFLARRKFYEPFWKGLRHTLNPLHSTLLHIEKIAFEHPMVKTVFTNSHMVKEEVLSYFTIDPNKIEVVHNGVEWANWQGAFDTWQEAKGHSPFRFLFLGNNFERKGLSPLLFGLKKLPTRAFHLSIVGKDKDQDRYEDLVKLLRLGSNVTFHGEQRDVRPFLQKSDCLVIPSYYDPFANATVEALAMGLFVVSSNSNGGYEVLTEETGTVIEDLSSEASMVKALEIALNHPKTPQSAFAIRESIKHLDFSTQLNAYLEICIPKQPEESGIGQGGSSKLLCGASDHCQKARHEGERQF